MTPPAGAILDENPSLTARKFDFSLSFGGDAVAHRGDIWPGTIGIEHRAVLTGSRTFKDQWTVYAAVRANNKTHRDFVGVRLIQQRIGSCQGLGRLRGCATCMRSAWYGGEF